MNYTAPSVEVLGAVDVDAGNWLYTETWAVGYAYVLVLVVVSQIDVTP